MDMYLEGKNKACYRQQMKDTYIQIRSVRKSRHPNFAEYKWN